MSNSLLLILVLAARGPLGGVMQIPWGTGINETHLRLSKTLTLAEYEREDADLQPNTPEKPLSHAGEKGFTLDYRGGFGQFEEQEIEEIEVSFDAKKRLSGLCVVFASDDPQPKSKTFETVVDVMTRLHGKPDRITEPRDSVSQLQSAARNAKVMKRSLGFLAASAGSKYEERDRLILSGAGEAMAAWRFADKSLVFVVVQSKLTESKERELSVLWCFSSPSK
jgi:hypothetical protein